MTGSPVYVSVIGAGDADSHALGAAETIGRELAARGAVTVCGGRGGVMEAACRGAQAAGGTTVGLLPDDDRRHANAYLTVSLPTGMWELRNGLVARAGDAVIAVGGEFGTLSEIGFALKLGRPVVGVGTWRFARGDGAAVAAVEEVGDPAEAVSRALALVAQNPR
ncbi:MAG: TIGR00725 family protein [Actinomycetota bacterium]|nr:TIGR00725 family protein [Actinomycetota bacterium]